MLLERSPCELLHGQSSPLDIQSLADDHSGQAVIMSYSQAHKANHGHPSRQFASEHVYDNALPIPTSTAVSYALLFIAAAFYLIQRSEMFPLLSLPELLWNVLVYITPPSVLLALDKQGNAALAAGKGDQGIYAASRTFGAKSEAMRRVLRLDGNGLLTSFQRSRRLSNLGSVFKAPLSKSLPGLGNWDNSCYQNSVIQGLASLPSLRKFLDKTRSLEPEEDSTSTKEALTEIIEQLNDTKNLGQRIWTPSALKSMSSWQQQDAQEYYSKVIDELDKEISKSLKTRPKSNGLVYLGEQGPLPQPTVPITHSSPCRSESVPKSKMLDQSLANVAPLQFQNPLEGLLAQRVGCLKCGLVEGLSLIPFNCLTVPLGRQWRYAIESCLDDYTTLEPISGVECANCTLQHQKTQLERLVSLRAFGSDNSDAPDALTENLYASVQNRLDAVNSALSTSDFSESTLSKRCMISSKSRITTTKSRQAVIARAPKSLVLHVNRSIFDEYSGIQSKNYADVHFPKTLDLGPWCLGSSGELGEEVVERWETNPARSMLLADMDEMVTTEGSVSEDTRFAPKKKLYILRAVVTHYGRHENGHYIAYRQDPQEAQAHDVIGSFSSWWRLSDDEVSYVNEEEVLAQGGVFMLFYEQIGGDSSAVARQNYQNVSCAATSANETDPLPDTSGTPTDQNAVKQESLQTKRELSGLPSEDFSSPDMPECPPTAPSASNLQPALLYSSPPTEPSLYYPTTQDASSKNDSPDETPPSKPRPPLAPPMRTAGTTASRPVDYLDSGGGHSGAMGMIQAN